MKNERYTGTVVFFDPRRGYGFIKPDHGETDLFVHFTGINQEGFRKLCKEDRVEYSLGENHRGVQCVEVIVLVQKDAA